MKLILTVTGGGSEVIGNLLRNGGASSYFLDAHVPYDTLSIDQILGGKPEKYCSMETAGQLSTAKLKQFIDMGHNPAELVSIACTASLAKPNQREGRINQAFIVASTIHSCYSHQEQFSITQDRKQQEYLTARQIQRIWKECEEGYNYQYWFVDLAKLWSNKLKFEGDFHQDTDVFFPGSFNPFHNGHYRIAEEASQITGKPVMFEISLFNARKPPICYDSLCERLQSLPTKTDWYAGYKITNAKTFVEKAILFPKCTFVVGMDTYNAIFDQKYYDREIFQIVEDFKLFGTKFLVFPRKGVPCLVEDYNFTTFMSVEDEGESSTEIRNVSA